MPKVGFEATKLQNEICRVSFRRLSPTLVIQLARTPLLQSKFYARAAPATVDHLVDAGRGCRQCRRTARRRQALEKKERTQVLPLLAELPARPHGQSGGG